MNKILRTPTRAEGGITPDEKAAMDDHAQLWISRALRTDPIDVGKITPAIEGIYAAAGLEKPRVAIASSPLVMAFAYGASAAIWHKNSATGSATGSATRSATDSATYSATGSATDSATYSATYSATGSATDSATYSATDSATGSATGSATDSATYSATDSATGSATDSATGASNACFDLAGELGISCAKRWWEAYQGGNMWAGYESYLTAARDILGLSLPEHDAYQHWEQAAIHGGFRVMHEKFCIVSDFPEFIHMDENNEPHSEVGPSHRWRDGWSLYHWHGVSVPAHWIEDQESLSSSEVLETENVEQRAAGISIIGMARLLDQLPHKIIDSDPDPMRGDLIQVTLPDLPDPVFYLKAECPRNGTIMEAVNPNDMDEMTVRGAQAWRLGIPASEFIYPTNRT